MAGKHRKRPRPKPQPAGGRKRGRTHARARPAAPAPAATPAPSVAAAAAAVEDKGVSMRPSDMVADEKDEGVSWRPSDMAAGEDADDGTEPVQWAPDEGDGPSPSLGFTQQTKVFRLSDDRNDKLGVYLSRTVRQALTYFMRSHGFPETFIFCCASAVGLDRIEGLSDSREIARVYELLIDRGADMAELDTWSFTPDRDGMRQLSMHKVPPRLKGGFTHRAKVLGLSASTLYGLAIRAGLAGVLLPAALAEQLSDDLALFRVALQKRANRASRIAALLQLQPNKRSRYDW